MSRFTKETFPKKWKIQITEENFDIVTPYYAKISTTYTGQDAVHEWIQSHNFRNQTPLIFGAGASFFGSSINDEFIPITVEEFKEFVLMENQFNVPEKYYIKCTNKEQDEVLIKYFNKLFDQKINPVSGHINQPIFYWNKLIAGSLWNVGINKADKEFVELSYEDFVKYVLNSKLSKEDHSQLIKLLNDAL